ncbi:MAG: zinc-ribbon domain-containing protein [Galactobacter sp.]
MTSCAAEGCKNVGAFRTRTRPTWCVEHLHVLYEEGGLILLDSFSKPADYLFTRCIRCGFEGHYRFEYVLDRRKHSEPVCRACYWTTWAKGAREYSGDRPVDLHHVQQKAEANGFTYLGPLTNPSLEEDPHGTRCNRCGRVEAQRPGDLGWGCTCSRNTKTATAGTKKSAGTNLLKNSDNKYVDWWDHDRNPPELWETAKLKGRKEAWWCCPEGHSFEQRILDVTGGYSSPCPECREIAAKEWEAKRAAYAGLTIADVPELLEAWEEDIPPETVQVDAFTGDSGYRFRCPANGHRNTRQPLSWLFGGCSACKAAETRRRRAEKAADNPTATRLTPEIASQWHPTKNGKLKLATISPDSRRAVWWRDPVCGHEFQATPRERDKYQRLRCPECHTILDSLAFHYPDIADEWSPVNSVSPWHIRPNTSQLVEPPLWICRHDPAHMWRAVPAARVNGSQCPECQITGKSMIERLYLDAARQHWGEVQSGPRIHSPAFSNHSSWSVDIHVSLPDGRSLVIEYDGCYWHKDKEDVDRIKSMDLLRDGHTVVRLREAPLLSLEIEDPNYHELLVYSGAQDPGKDIQAIGKLVAD